VAAPEPLTLELIKSLTEQVDVDRGHEVARLKRVDAYMQGEQDLPYLPQNATVEFRQLRERARLNLLPLIVDSSADALRISGYRTPGAKDDSPTWKSWQTAGMDAKHAKLISSAVANGCSYASVVRGTPSAVVKCYSARQAFAIYDDPTSDVYPEYVLLTKTNGTIKGLVDDNYFYDIGRNADGQLIVKGLTPHMMGKCPFIRITPDMDLEGRHIGEVEPHIRLQDRLTQSIMDMLIVSNYGAHRIVLASGIEQPKDPVTKKPIPIEVSAKRILTTPAADARLATAAGTPLDGYLRVIDQAAAHMAIASRTPAQALMADLTNIGEGTLTASGQGHDSKIAGYKLQLGEQFEALLQLMAFADGRVDEEPDAEVTWADIGVRSLAQVSDPLVKLAQGLAIPPQVLWSKIPGFTQQDISESIRLQKEQDPITALKAAGFAVKDSIMASSKSDAGGSWLPATAPAPAGGAPAPAATGAG
jgi:hypothetical protein